MNDSVMRYLLRKMTRTEVCEAAIKAIRTKEGMNFQVGGRGIELIELIAELIGTLAKKSEVSFETMLEILKAEYETDKDITRKEYETKINNEKEEYSRLFEEMFKDLNL